MNQKAIKVHVDDNVIVALQDIAKGEVVSFNGVTYEAADDIPSKHKFFTNDMHAGDEITMYGVLVGKAQNFIPAGGLMTTKNVKHAAEPYKYRGSFFNGKHRMLPNLKPAHLMVIIAAMGEWARQITGYLFPLFFARTVILMSSAKPCTMN